MTVTRLEDEPTTGGTPVNSPVNLIEVEGK